VEKPIYISQRVIFIPTPSLWWGFEGVWFL